jgi:hypothetical protein
VKTRYCKFTDKLIESLVKAPPAGGHGVVSELRDHVCSFLMLRVMASGTVTYYAVAAVKGEGRTTRLSLGKVTTISLAAARQRAAEVAEALMLGRIVETDISRQRRLDREAVEAERAAKEAAKLEAERRKALRGNVRRDVPPVHHH